MVDGPLQIKNRDNDMSGRLHGKVCVVTGTGGAIGRASALAFAKEGAMVFGCDIQESSSKETVALVRKSGGDMLSVEPCDLSRAADCARVAAEVEKKFGRIDVLFNNASKPSYGWMDEPDDAYWWKTIDHELHNVYLMCKAAWPALTKSGGNIINMASVSGWIGLPALPGVAHSAAKSGVHAMTRHLAMEGRTAGVRANSISPGVIGTPSVLARARDPQWNEMMLSKIMRGTYGTPEEIAAVAVFLASEESAFINGADIRVDGGMTAW